MTPLAVDFQGGVTNAFDSIATFVPKLLAFLVILIVGYFLAKIIGKIIDKALERLGFDRAVERGGVKTAMAKSKYDASDIVSKLVFYTIFLFVLQFAFGVFGTNPISDLIQGVITFLPKVFVAIVIIVVASAIAKAVNDLLVNTLGGLSYGSIVAKVASGLILFFGVVAALQQIEVAQFVTQAITTAVLVAVVGTIIIGVGGGLVKPMQNRWEDLLSKASDEGQNARQHLQSQREQQAYAGNSSYDSSDAPTSSYQSGGYQSGSTRR